MMLWLQSDCGLDERTMYFRPGEPVENNTGNMFDPVLLFAYGNFAGQDNCARRWTPDDPLNTPVDLKDEKTVVAILEQSEQNIRKE